MGEVVSCFALKSLTGTVHQIPNLDEEFVS